MPDKVSKMDFYTANVPDKAGEGARILAAVREAGVNLSGFLGYRVKARQAEVVFMVEGSAAGLKKAAKNAGLELSARQQAFFVTGTDRIGAVAEIMQKLAAAGINVQKAHALCGGAGRFGAMLVVAPEDHAKAAKALSK